VAPYGQGPLNFGNVANPSLWYDHIKRNIFGKTQSYATTKFPNFYQPSMAVELDDWFLKKQELVAPTIVKMDSAMDYTGLVNAANEVGLFVYDPLHSYGSGGIAVDLHKLWPDADSKVLELFKEDDRWAVTYVYDHVQESELSRDGDGNIGITGFEAIPGVDPVDSGSTTGIAVTATTPQFLISEAIPFASGGFILINGEEMRIIRMDQGSGLTTITVERGYNDTEITTHGLGDIIYFVGNPQKARAINLVPYIGTIGTDWNERITGINVYWQPTGDIDWYYVGHLDTEKGYSDSSVANFEAPEDYDNIKSNGANGTNNFGFWQACPDGTSKSTPDPEFRAAEEPSSGEANWVHTAGFTQAVVGDIAIGNILPTGDVNVATLFNLMTSYRGRVWVRTDNNIAFEATYIHGNRFNLHPYLNLDLELTSIGVFALRTDVITNWYMPFDGLKIATYQGLTGREETERIRAYRWKSSCEAENGEMYIFNVDSIDDQGQTLHERSRLMWTSPGKSDDFHITRSIPMGKNDGDEGVAVVYWNGRIFAFKERNLYVRNVVSQMRYQEGHYPGYGCYYRHAAVATPYGVCAVDIARINLYDMESRPVELTFPWRDDYQALTLNRPTLSYSGKTNELYFIPDTSGTDLDLYKYNFDSKSWSQQTMPATSAMSNMRMGEAMEPMANFYLDDSQDVVQTKEFNNAGTDNTDAADVKTYKFDGGNPYREKNLRIVRIIYKTDDEVADALTIKIYRDGSATISDTLTFGASAALTIAADKDNITNAKRTFKTLELRVQCAGQDLAIDDVAIEWSWMGLKT